MESLKEFKDKIKKVKGPRKAKITNSYGVQHAYRFYMKLIHAKKQKPLPSHDYYKIIRGVNKLLGEQLLTGEIIQLPYRMGELLIGKFEGGARIDKEGKLKVGYPINWEKTLDLWYEDEDAMRDKILVRYSDRQTAYKAFLSKRSAHFANQRYYNFNMVRPIMQQINIKQREGTMSGFLLYKPNYG